MPPQTEDNTRVTVPVVEETAAIDKRKRITGTVRLRTVVHEDEIVVDEPLHAEEITVERVPVDRWVDGPIPVRQEGDTTIVPIIEEVIVVEKRLRVIEEVRITKRNVTRRAPQQITVRRQQAIVDRLAPTAPNETAAAGSGGNVQE